MIATLVFKCGCGAIYSMATFDNSGLVDSPTPSGTIDEWLAQHLEHNVVTDGKCTMQLRLMGYAGRGKLQK